jgi:hypothetical protein
MRPISTASTSYAYLAMCIFTLFTIFLLKETKGQSLEDMDLLFGTIDEVQHPVDVEQVLRNGLVSHVEQVD